MPEPVRFKNEPPKKSAEKCSEKEECSVISKKNECEESAECIEVCQNKNSGILSNVKLDDIIIIAVILLLVMDNCEDKLLIIALAFLLFSDFFEF